MVINTTIIMKDNEMNNQKNKKLNPDELMADIIAEFAKQYSLKIKEINNKQRNKKQ